VLGEDPGKSLRLTVKDLNVPVYNAAWGEPFLQKSKKDENVVD